MLSRAYAIEDLFCVTHSGSPDETMWPLIEWNRISHVWIVTLILLSENRWRWKRCWENGEYSKNKTLKHFSSKTTRLMRDAKTACDITGTVPRNDQVVIGPRAVWDGHRFPTESKWSMSLPSIWCMSGILNWRWKKRQRVAAFERGTMAGDRQAQPVSDIAADLGDQQQLRIQMD